MPEITTETFSLENKSPGELEQRRRDIVLELQTKYTSYDDPNIPITLLHELSVITSTLRRKTAGPPKEAKAKTSTRKTSVPKSSIGDLMSQLTASIEHEAQKNEEKPA